jgi:serine/threonine-protein kinase
MATVYRAYDPRFKREIAIKLLPREFLHDPTFRARFEREAQTIAALEHPAIVPVYDYGEENDQPYLVMRLMTGGSLADRLANGPLPLIETSHILSRLAPALDRAHSLGIVHRDLKPGNILFDGDGNPYISDFGLAKLTQSNTQLSQSGVMGTPAYMSPEQARGDKEIDGRADLYALGAILYQMLTGKLPYEADTPIGLVLKHVTEPPPRLREARPDLPQACDAIVAQAMAKEPDKRFSTASRLTEALASALEAPPPAPEPVAPRTPTPTLLPTAAQPEYAPTLLPEQPASNPRPRPVAAPPPVSPPVWPRPVSPLLLGGIAVAVIGLLGVVLVGIFLFRNLPGAGTPTAQAQGQSTPAGLNTAAPNTPAPETPGAPTDTIATSTIAPLITATPTDTLEPTPTPGAGATRTSPEDGMLQVYVPEGEFTMGNDAGPADQRPAHTVFLDAFWIDHLEVTNAMYALCVEVQACTPPLQLDSITRPRYYDEPGYENHPVLYVNWFQAETYCKWAGRRLPTEAEWVKAARGTDGRLYPWGNEPPNPELLNFRASGFGDTVGVGSYNGNISPYGAVDMAGNVSEWVADFYDPNYYAVSPSDNPPGPEQTGCEGGDCRVLRGGNWNGTPDDVTTTFRLFYGVNDSRDAFSIRCAQTP